MAKTFSVTNKESFQGALNDLTQKINDVAKQISYFDIYNIVDTVVDKNLFASQVNALTNYSSLVINTEPFYVNGVSYNTGDIILKNDKGQAIHIKAQTGGIYYPSKIVKDASSNSFSIQYAYSAIQPEPDSTANYDIVLNPDGITTPAEKITISGFSTDLNKNYVYGLWREFGNGSFSVFTREDVIVKPYIKFYLVSKDENGEIVDMEEIYLDYSLNINEEKTTWTISLTDDFVDSANLWIKVK